MQIVYIWPSCDDGRRWIRVLPGTQYSHSRPATHIMSSKAKEGIQKVVSDDSTKSTKEIMKGFGFHRARRERKMALGKWTSAQKEFRPLDEILGFENIREKVEGN